MRTYGTTARGIRTPVIKEGDDLAGIVVDALLGFAQDENVELHDRDVVGITESVLARAQGNYATTQQIAGAVREVFPGGEAAIIFPILSRNRFATVLSAICEGLDQAYLILSYPTDEVGNELVDIDAMLDKGVNPYTDTFTLEQFRETFGSFQHRFTGIDYLQFYAELADNITVILSNDPCAALKYTPHCLAADIHSRHSTKKKLQASGAKTVIGLDDLLRQPFDASGHNAEYGLLGSNMASGDRVKLFPRDCKAFVESVQQKMQDKTGKKIEVMIYGDGAFKDPVGGIWELADPVVSPAFTSGLAGTPNELKFKYLADTQFQHLDGEEADKAIREYIREKEQLEGRAGTELALGTTPRQITDLIGSLCDLISGSGDKGTPVVLIQGYFDNYAS